MSLSTCLECFIVEWLFQLLNHQRAKPVLLLVFALTIEPPAPRLLDNRVGDNDKARIRDSYEVCRSEHSKGEKSRKNVSQPELPRQCLAECPGSVFLTEVRDLERQGKCGDHVC